MDKYNVKRLQNGHRDAARKSAHPMWKVHRGDQGVVITKIQTESAQRQEQETDKVEVTAAGSWWDDEKLRNRIRRKLEQQDSLQERLKQVQKGQPGARPQPPAGTPTHKEVVNQEKKLERERLKTQPQTRAEPTPPTTPKQQREKDQFDKAQEQAKAQPADPNPTNDPALGPEHYQVPADYKDPSGMDDYADEGSGGPIDWMKRKWRNLTTPDLDMEYIRDQVKRMPDMRTLRAWAIASMPDPQDVDKVIQRFITKAENKAVAGDPNLGRLRNQYIGYAQQVHQHRLRYINYLVNELDKQKSVVRKAEMYDKIRRWVTRQQLNDAVKNAIFHALTFLRDNSKKMLDQENAKISRIIKVAARGKDVMALVRYLEVLQEAGVDISDPNKIIGIISRLKAKAPQMKQMFDRAVQAAGGYPQLIDYMEMVQAIEEDTGEAVEMSQLPSQPMQVPATPPQVPTNVPAPEESAESFGMQDIPTALSSKFDTYIGLLSSMTTQQLDELSDTLSGLDEEEQVAAQPLSQAIEAERIKREDLEDLQINKTREFAQNPANRLRLQNGKDGPYYLTQAIVGGQTMLIRKMLDGRALPVEPGDAEQYEAIEQQLQQQGLISKPVEKPVAPKRPATPPPAGPPTPVYDDALKRLRAPRLEPKPQIPSAPITPAQPPVEKPVVHEPVEQGMEDIVPEVTQPAPVEPVMPQPAPVAPTPQMQVPQPVQTAPVPAPQTPKRRPLQIEQDYGVDLNAPPAPQDTSMAEFKPPDAEKLYEFLPDEGIWITVGDGGGLMTQPDSDTPMEFGQPLRLPSKQRPGAYADVHIKSPLVGAAGNGPIKAFIGQGVMNKMMFTDIMNTWREKPPVNDQGQPLYTRDKDMRDAAVKQSIGYITGYGLPPGAEIKEAWLRVYHPFVGEDGVTVWAPNSIFEEDRGRGVLQGNQHPNFGEPGYPGGPKKQAQVFGPDGITPLQPNNQQPPQSTQPQIQGPMQAEAPAGTLPQGVAQPGAGMPGAGMPGQPANNGQLPQQPPPDVQSTGQKPADSNITLQGPHGEELKLVEASMADIVTDR